MRIPFEVLGETALETTEKLLEAAPAMSLGSGPKGYQHKNRKSVKAKRRQNKTRLIQAKRKK